MDHGFACVYSEARMERNSTPRCVIWTVFSILCGTHPFPPTANPVSQEAKVVPQLDPLHANACFLIGATSLVKAGVETEHGQ